MNRKSNAIALTVFAVIFFFIVAANIFQPERATVSTEENRELAKFPEFSFESLINGKFLLGIDNFISDTFIFRTELIDFSRKITSLWSANTFFGSGDNDIIFIPSNVPTETVELDSPLDLIEKDKTENKPDDTPEEDEPTEPAISDTPDNPPEDKTDDDTSTEDSTTKDPEIIPDIPEEENQTPDDITTEVTENTTPEEPQKAEEPVPDDNLSEIADPLGIGEPEFLSSGEIIYNGAVISIPYLVKNVAKYYSEVVSYYKYLFPDSRVSVLCSPLSSAMVDAPSLKNKITDQNGMINTINGYLSEDINGINCFDELYSHRKEYLFFKSDHHWTSRGAYYAYVAFAESLGLKPTPIENFKEELLNPKWKGSAFSMTGDERVKEFTDEVYAYIPTKKHTMTTYNSKGEVGNYNSSIITGYASYSAFLEGDNAYTIINVPENPQDMTILVLKDSYGRAFIPYLVEHYGTIIVVDPRYIYFNIYEHLKNYKLTDILFVNNLYNPNVASYPKNLMRAVGK